jgi:hypothetical protein
MSHRGVENVLGRLATDTDTRRRFKLAPVQTLRELMALGVELTPDEIEALESLDPTALNRFAQALDQRLRKAVLVTDDTGDAPHVDGNDSGESR